MSLDSDTLSIPETEYEPRVTMVSSEFTRIIRDLSQFGESVRIEVNKEGVRFTSDGAAANDKVSLLQAEEEAEGSTSEKEEKKVKSDNVGMVDGDDDKQNDAEFEQPSALT